MSYYGKPESWPMNNPNPAHHPPVPPQPCPQLPGTLVRVFIPAGAVINLLNLIEVSSPSGICLILRIPALGGSGATLSTLMDSVKQAGGSVEFM